MYKKHLSHLRIWVPGCPVPFLADFLGLHLRTGAVTNFRMGIIWLRIRPILTIIELDDGKILTGKPYI